MNNIREKACWLLHRVDWNQPIWIPDIGTIENPRVLLPVLYVVLRDHPNDPFLSGLARRLCKEYYDPKGVEPAFNEMQQRVCDEWLSQYSDYADAHAPTLAEREEQETDYADYYDDDEE